MFLVLGLWSVLVVVQAPAQQAARAAVPRAAASDKDWHAEATRGAVTAGGRAAVAAGLEILKKGGNAADSAAATILALSSRIRGRFVSVARCRSWFSMHGGRPSR